MSVSGRFSTDSLERCLESADEVGDVAHRAVLMVEPAVHFLSYVGAVLLEFTERVCLDPLNLVSLALQFVFKFLNEIGLLLLACLTLSRD